MMTSRKQNSHSVPPTESDFRAAMRSDIGSDVPPSEAVDLIVVGLDPPTEALVREVVEGSEGFRIESVGDMLAARVAIETRRRPTIVVVSSMRLRAKRTLPAYVHVIGVTGTQGSIAPQAEADELLRRPLDPHDLRGRLRLAARALLKTHALAPIERLRDLCSEGTSGEMVVARGNDLARIHVEHGRVAWVHRPRQSVSLRSLFAVSGIDISDEAAREVLEESRVTRRHFGDVLVEWGMVDRASVTEALRKYVESELGAIFEWSDASVTFMENDRPTTSAFSFDAVDVLPSRRRLSIRASAGMAAAVAYESALDEVRIGAWLDRIDAVASITGSALLDVANGVVLGARGSFVPSADVAWRMASGFSALGSDADELVATAKKIGYFVRAIPELSSATVSAVAVVCFDVHQLSPALARILLLKAFASSDAGAE